MFKTGTWAWLPVMALIVASVLFAQELPKIEGDSLAGHHVTLPDAASGKVTVLVLGFTKASKTPTSAWGNRIEADFASTADFTLYQLPVLEDVPGFIRGMVISNIKKGVPENQRGYFVPVLHGESDLKKLAHYKEPDDAYLILLDRRGGIAYQIHGILSEPAYSEFRRHIVALLR
jgi:hypothetical protein